MYKTHLRDLEKIYFRGMKVSKKKKKKQRSKKTTMSQQSHFYKCSRLHIFASRPTKPTWESNEFPEVLAPAKFGGSIHSLPLTKAPSILVGVFTIIGGVRLRNVQVVVPIPGCLWLGMGCTSTLQLIHNELRKPRWFSDDLFLG